MAQHCMRRKRRSSMNKIICDVCGTAYPETASQCPICGYAKGADPSAAAGDSDRADASAASSYKYVKGGRFSKRNVKKRNMQNLSQQKGSIPEEEDTEDFDNGGNKGLVVLLLLLLAAIVAVVIFIAVRFFAPGTDSPTTAPLETTVSPTASVGTTEPSAAETTEATTVPTTEPTYPCTGLTIREPKILLDQPGGTARIAVSASPANTTDSLQYSSDNEAVAIVSSDGTVTAVGEGSARITVTCGSFVIHCDVDVVYPTSEPTTEPTTEPSTEPSTEPAGKLTLNRSDFSLFGPGESWNVYSGSLPLNQISWSSSNEKVATVKNGVVTAVSPGQATIYAEYQGEKVSCIVRCNWQEETTESTTAPTPDPDETYSISHTDVTISVGESFYLTLKDSSGNAVNVTWQASRSGYVSISGNKVTGEAAINSNSFTVYTTVGGQTYSCIVRVK